MKAKCNEIYLNVREQEGEQPKRFYPKIKFSYSHKVNDVQTIIKDYLLNSENREVNEDHIQLIKENGTRVKYKENVNIVELIYDSNTISFEVLPYSLKQLGTNVIVKVHDYWENGCLN